MTIDPQLESFSTSDAAAPLSGWAAARAEVHRYLFLFFDYFLQYAKVRIGYRGDFFISLGTSFAATIFALGFVIILFQKVPQLAGWTFEDVLFL
ncbi:MAG: hypothetical protein ACRD5R_12655 [Candidatus Acidiferrales bacterium]